MIAAERFPALHHLLDLAPQLDRIDRVAVPLRPADPVERELAEAEHHGHHVVDLVGDPTGELANSFHLLNLPGVFLGPLARVEIVADFVLATARPDRSLHGTQERHRMDRPLEEGQVSALTQGGEVRLALPLHGQDARQDDQREIGP